MNRRIAIYLGEFSGRKFEPIWNHIIELQPGETLSVINSKDPKSLFEIGNSAVKSTRKGVK